jgi:hypothetical protein
MLALDVIFGNSPVPGLLGILVGHTYYFLTAVYPRQSGGTELLRTPKFVYPPVRTGSHLTVTLLSTHFIHEA